MSTSDYLIVVSNRLPITVRTTATGCSLESSGGGLVSALTPVLRENCSITCTSGQYSFNNISNVLRQCISSSIIIALIITKRYFDEHFRAARIAVKKHKISYRYKIIFLWSL